MNKIDNMSFTYEEYGIEFTYTEDFNNSKQSKAYLQLPSTGDSVHYINDVEVENTEQEDDIISQLVEHYFDSFGDDDGELAAASAQVGEEVSKVVPVSFVNMDFYVAFTDDSAHVLKENRSRSYYNKRYLFSDTDAEDFEVIEKAGDDAFAIHKYKVIEMARKEAA
tara:strand:- start:18 stop:515 length:498 start_codon:yes stop_codon:yes gene_type:complete